MDRRRNNSMNKFTQQLGTSAYCATHHKSSEYDETMQLLEKAQIKFQKNPTKTNKRTIKFYKSMLKGMTYLSMQRKRDLAANLTKMGVILSSDSKSNGDE